MESQAGLFAWLHEIGGYDFYTIPGLTYPELKTLQLGYIVRQEQQQDALNAGGSGTASERNKREHKRSIVRRLRRQ